MLSLGMQTDPIPTHKALLSTHAIDTFRMPTQQAREVWQHIVDGTFELEGLNDPDRGFRVRTQVWFLEDLLLAGFAAEPNVVHRTRSLISLNPTPVVKVRIYRSGYSLLIDGDAQKAIGTGAIHFIDHDRPVRQVSSEHEQITMSVPYHLIGYDPAVHPACLSIGLDTPRGRLLQAGFETVFSEIGRVSPSEAPALAAAFVGLLRGTLAGSGDSRDDKDMRTGRMAAMKRYIDQNLGDPELGIDALLRDFGASRATIYRDFGEEGGLQHYILERRLQRAYRLLAESPPVRGAVQEVALRCGFGALPHFSRCFRGRFGIVPSDLLGQWNDSPDRPAIATAGGQVARLGNPASIYALQWAYKRFR